MEFILHQLEMTYFWIFCKVQLSILWVWFSEYFHFRRGRICDQIIVVFGSSIKIQRIIFFISLRKKPTFLQPKSLPATCNIMNHGGSSYFFINLIFIVLSNKFRTITVGNPDTNVWIVGSSIIKEAFVSARSRPGGTCLGLGRLNVSTWWQGKRGMVVSQF
jgi:hypothetical protein